MKVCFCEITQFPNRHEINPRVLMSGCVFSSHLSSYFHKLPLTCRTFTCDDNIHSSLCVDKKMDVMAQIRQEIQTVQRRLEARAALAWSAFMVVL